MALATDLEGMLFTSMMPRVNETLRRPESLYKSASVVFISLNWLCSWYLYMYIYFLQAKKTAVFPNYAGQTLEVAIVYLYFWFNGIIIVF